jgi:hypothetical protein
MFPSSSGQRGSPQGQATRPGVRQGTGVLDPPVVRQGAGVLDAPQVQRPLALPDRGCMRDRGSEDTRSSSPFIGRTI